MKYSFRRRLPWGVLFGLLVAAAVWAMGKIPYTDPMDIFNCVLSADRDKLTVGHVQFNSSNLDDHTWGWVQHIDVDLETGMIEPRTQERSIRSLFSQPPPKESIGEVEQFQYRRMRREILYARNQWNVNLVGGRYLVGHHAENFRRVDFHDGQTKRKEFDSPGSGAWYSRSPEATVLFVPMTRRFAQR